jgi:hypothetical protein
LVGIKVGVGGCSVGVAGIGAVGLGALVGGCVGASVGKVSSVGEGKGVGLVLAGRVQAARNRINSRASMVSRVLDMGFLLPGVAGDGRESM